MRLTPTDLSPVERVDAARRAVVHQRRFGPGREAVKRDAVTERSANVSCLMERKRGGGQRSCSPLLGQSNPLRASFGLLRWGAEATDITSSV